jgi:hypothetical protein
VNPNKPNEGAEVETSHKSTKTAFANERVNTLYYTIICIMPVIERNNQLQFRRAEETDAPPALN